jgi:uncharacterized small protein (DUF1192 family)
MNTLGTGRIVRMTKDELERLKAIAFGKSECEFDQAFWSDGGKTVQALITEIERLNAEIENLQRSESLSREAWVALRKGRAQDLAATGNDFMPKDHP